MKYKGLIEYLSVTHRSTPYFIEIQWRGADSAKILREIDIPTSGKMRRWDWRTGPWNYSFSTMERPSHPTTKEQFEMIWSLADD